jgi:hypothetical protein
MTANITVLDIPLNTRNNFLLWVARRHQKFTRWHFQNMMKAKIVVLDIPLNTRNSFLLWVARHHQKFTKWHFQNIMEAKIAVLEISLNTRKNVLLWVARRHVRNLLDGIFKIWWKLKSLYWISRWTHGRISFCELHVIRNLLSYF